VLIEAKKNKLVTNQPEKVVSCLNTGGVVLLPTDTVFGLAVRPQFYNSVQRLFSIKNRPIAANLPVMVATPAEIEKSGGLLNRHANLLLESAYIPGPITIVLGVRRSRLPHWLQEREEVAFRIPKDERILRILRETGPLFVTSANLHGMCTGKDQESILSKLSGSPDLILSGCVNSEIASTVVNCRIHPPRVEREGQIPTPKIEQIWSEHDRH